jgi:hypothetical protein
MRRIANIEVSEELIEQAFALPEGSRIENISRSSLRTGVFVFTIEHPDLPEVEEGNAIPQITPLLTADYEKRPATWITFDWNLK